MIYPYRLPMTSVVQVRVPDPGTALSSAPSAHVLVETSQTGIWSTDHWTLSQTSPGSRQNIPPISTPLWLMYVSPHFTCYYSLMNHTLWYYNPGLTIITHTWLSPNGPKWNPPTPVVMDSGCRISLQEDLLKHPKDSSAYTLWFETPGYQQNPTI